MSLVPYQMRRKLQRHASSNTALLIPVVGGWFILSFMVTSFGGFAEGVFLLPVLAGLHYFWGRQVLGYIFGYVRNKAVDLDTFFSLHEEFWKKYIGGLAISVFLFMAGGWVGTLLSLIGAWKARKDLMIPLAVEFEGGTRPVPHWWLKEEYDDLRPANDAGVFFGGLWLPTTEVNTHFLLAGTNGSGKTNLLRLYMQSTLPRCGTQDRALVYDAKSEFIPLLAGMGVRDSLIKVLNPFDARGYAWDMAEDLTRGRDAVALASILLPEKANSGGNNEFFDKAARRILSGVTRLFMRYAPGLWTLRDVVLAAQSFELVTALLTQDKQLRRNLSVLGAGDTVGNVMASVGAVIGDELETIAAHLDFHQQEGRRFTLKEWFDQNYILMLGCDRESEATLRPYNQLIFTRMAQMLASPSNTGGNTFIILDELPSLGKLDKIEEVARIGRSYGGSLCIAFQAYTDLEHIYGEKIANSLIGQCDKAAYLRARDRKTADWASNQIGHMKKTWRSETVGTGTSQGRLMPLSGTVSQNQSFSEQRESDPVVRPEDVMNIPKPDKRAGTGVKGFFRCDQYVFDHEVSSAYLSHNMQQAASSVDGYLPVYEGIEDCRLWDEEDIERLGIGGFMAVFEEKDMKALPIEDWVRLNNRDVGLPDMDLPSENEGSTQGEI
ncbi:type IV secretory system conjugative DNA transfer family protein [Nostoc sp. CHAB 5715]|uniref:type IV secretory system conjugative DNA transfer family protein n=1 Tax=Nostoc sp. CHAB 5715 TaxID=2780400 RepID=UPI001E522DCB|nr:type IV secretion system DNA-binding domain-containing protein [Nostoc sp. CHAB 5715]MCC5624462.1 type IV secretion system DNA-binding domain-containing protein [Nostoc sp. CHAB 5715]